MTTKLIALTLLSVTACAAAQRDAGSAPPRTRTEGSATNPPMSTRDGGSNAFAYDLYDQLRSEPGNFAYSPSSISLALAMTYGGARGETAEQMRNVMHFGADADELHKTNAALLSDWNDPKRKTYELRVVNRLFGEKTATFVPDFLDLTARQYGAKLEPVDFIGAPDASRLRINAWVEEQTKDRIKDLLPQGSIDSLARLVLTNAIYFKGKWKQEFDPKATTPGDFHRIPAHKQRGITGHDVQQ